MGGKEGKVFRNHYKGDMDKAGGWKQGREMEMAVGGGQCGGLNTDNCTRTAQ